MKKMKWKKNTGRNALTYLGVTAAFVILQGLSAAGMLSSTVRGFLVPLCAYIVMAISLNLLVGVCGELSLGHAGFMSIGAFTGIVTAALLQAAVPAPVVRLILAMAAGGVLAGVMGFLVGVPVLRLRGDYLAIVTLAFGEIIKNLIGNLYIGTDSRGFHFAITTSRMELEEGGRLILSGPLGATGVQKLSTFAVGFGLILVTLFVVLNLINSREGRAIRAVRDNRIAAESVGINVTAFRLKAFVISAVLAGMAGALFGLNYSSLTASKFNFNTSINVLVFVVLGGMGNIPGCILATVVLYILPEALRGLEDFRMILYAVVLIVVMLCTWSPSVKNRIEELRAAIRQKFSKKEEMICE